MKAEEPELPLDTMELQMGPSHPATHGTIKFNLKLEGDARRLSEDDEIVRAYLGG